MNTIKKIIAVAVAMAACVSAFAQAAPAEKYQNEDMGKRVIINRWYQNWEVGARIGTQAYLGEYVLDQFKIKDWWNIPAVDLSLSKWGTQSIGLAMGFTFSPMKSLYYTGVASTEPKYATFATLNDEVYKQNFNIARGNMGNAYISVIFDVNNMFYGYKKDRFYNLVASIGGGLMFPLSDTQYNDICASFNAGLINKFNITNHFSIDLAFRGTLHDDMFNGVSYYNSDDHQNLSVDATFGATLGISYRFDLPAKKAKAKAAKKANEEGWTTVDEIVYYTDAYKGMEKAAKEAIARAEAAEAQRDSLKAAAAVPVVVAEKEPFYYKQLVNFVIDRWEISNREKVAIMFAAEAIKAHPDMKFRVQGYADKQTSYPRHNQFLSEQRAKVVTEMLVNEFGVDRDQLVVSAHGGVDYMFFHDEQCSRSTIISSINE